MSNPGAFKASYSDWKLIKTRGVVQIVLEVPLEASGAAYDVLGGMPNAAKEIWCAVALLKPEGGDQPEHGGNARTAKLDTAPRQETKTGGARSWGDLPYAQQAALACNDPVFRAFLREGLGYAGAIDIEAAATAIRLHCGVDSRAELNTDNDAGRKWSETWIRYGAWKLDDRVSA
jgi:hypothetical protein